jgi:predicted ArsR family transcriptional regulator
MADLSDSKRRIVDRLKRVESATASELAETFGLTDTAVRQHLEAMEHAGLVVRQAGTPDGRGRPPVRWTLTADAEPLFPNRHADLTVDLLATIRNTLGDEALSSVIETRAQRQLDHYRALLPRAGLRRRMQVLAEQRTREGYVAELDTHGPSPETDPNRVVLTEHHCPIRDAASQCHALCAAELRLFQQALGDDVEVVRIQHVLAGDSRCSYAARPLPCSHG